MSSLISALGLRAASPGLNNIPNYTPAYLCFHFAWAYCALASRTMKQYYGLDHNVSPRYDLIKYGDEAVASSKITQRQLEMMRRTESASANSVENFTLFVAATGFATFSGVDRHLINRAGLVYTLARIVYGTVYVLVDHPLWSQIRGITWWIGNGSCLYLLWKASKVLNRGCN